MQSLSLQSMKQNLLLTTRICRARLDFSKRFKSSESEKKTSSQEEEGKEVDPKSYYYPNTSFGIKERTIQAKGKQVDPLQTPYPPFPDGKNPKTGETGGPVGPEPTRYGDWERKGRVTDF